MTDDVEISDISCPKCGHYVLSQRCQVLGCDDGWIDMHEYDDPILFDPGEEEQCTECKGRGFVEWCPECGYEITLAHYQEQPTPHQEA